jgi:hypothetical protein
MTMEKNEMLVPDRILQLLEMEGVNTLFGMGVIQLVGCKGVDSMM